MQFPSISLVIPCYNESSRIHLMYEGIKAFVQSWQGDYEIIIVNDGSTDKTALALTEDRYYTVLKTAQKITLLQQANKGKGAALQLGIHHASKHFVLTLDADMATQPTELLLWLKLRKDFYPKELLIASRELKNSVVKDSFKRKLVGNVFNFCIRTLVKLNITDTQCGFKLYPTTVAKQLFETLQTLGWAHDVEILAKANKSGYAIIEMPVTWNAIEGSKIKVLQDGWAMFWELWAIRKTMKTYN